MLKPTDKVSARLMSELLGCREKFSERGRPHNCGHGKGVEWQQDGGVAHSSDEVW